MTNPYEPLCRVCSIEQCVEKKFRGGVSFVQLCQKTYNYKVVLPKRQDLSSRITRGGTGPLLEPGQSSSFMPCETDP